MIEYMNNNAEFVLFFPALIYFWKNISKINQ